MDNYSPSNLHSNEILVDFDSNITEEDWARLFREAKAFPKCNGQCLSGYGPSATRYDGSRGKCIYCNFEAKK